MFVDECHVTSVNQGLLSTTMEAEKRDPGNEVAPCSLLEVGQICKYSISLIFLYLVYCSWSNGILLRLRKAVLCVRVCVS